jgi:hypothetical protein
MVDRDLRQHLSQDLRRLVTGRMTNDDFDDAYDERYRGSHDAAVDQIAKFGWSLYSDDFPYRLRGRHALDDATRRTAARCVLLLRTGLDYQWPNHPSSIAADTLWALAFNLGFPGGIALLICSLPALFSEVPDPEFFWPLALFGAVSLIMSAWYLFGSGGYAAAYNSPEWRAWRVEGDYDVWPFLRREDFYRARSTAYLLGGRTLGNEQR